MRRVLPRRRHGRPGRRGRIIATLLAAAFVALAGVGLAPASSAAQDRTVHLDLFWSNTCPHCATELTWLDGLVDRHPGVIVDRHEIHEQASQDLLAREADRLGFTPGSVPVTIIGDLVWIGFDDRVAGQIEAVVVARLAGQPDPEHATDRSVIDVPLLGSFDASASSLVVSTLVIGFVDGVNPCSLWVLSMLLALVLHSGSRGRVALVGITFLTVTTALYALYIVGLYSVLSYISYVTWIRVAVAALALTFGVINIKDFFWFKRGVSLTISDSAKPGLLRRMRDVAGTQRSVPATLAATALLAVGVSLIETPCTAGFPLIWANLLADQGVGRMTAAALFGLYMFVFLLDELAVFGVAVVSMRAIRMQESGGQLLKLVGGTVMVTLAVVMVVAPSLLESIAGTIAVFGGAIGLAIGVAAVHRRVASPG